MKYEILLGARVSVRCDIGVWLVPLCSLLSPLCISLITVEYVSLDAFSHSQKQCKGVVPCVSISVYN